MELGEPMIERTFKTIVMVGSAGGTSAIAAVLSGLPATFPLPILVAQHLHPGDGGSAAAHLDRVAALAVSEVCDKEAIRPGHVHVAPADYHLLVEREETLALSVDEKVNWCRPSFDVLFESAARVWGAALIGVIFSGSNHDGAEGMRAVAEHGGLAIAQTPGSAEYPEMPRAAISVARIETVLPPQDIADLLLTLGPPSRRRPAILRPRRRGNEHE